LAQKIGSTHVIEMVMSVYKTIESEQSWQALKIPGWGPNEDGVLLADKNLSGTVRGILSTRSRR
jgi:hypothetical protein